MEGKLNINFGSTANDYSKYRAGFPDAFFDLILDAGFIKAGAALLDLGTGTGTLARGFALRGFRVTAGDISSQMLKQAKRLDQQAGVGIDYHVTKAEQTGFPDSTFDIVTAGQCWHWFDRPKAAHEVKRILKPGSTIVIASFDWIPLAGNIVELTEHLIAEYNPAWHLGGGLGIHPQYLRDLGEAGFEGINTFSFDVDVPYSRDGWRGRIRASAGVGASLPPLQVERFDSDLKKLLEEKFQALAGRDLMLSIPHRVFSILARKPSSPV